MGKQETLETIWEVPDELWERVEPIILETDPPKARGRKRADPRQMLNGIIFRLRSGCQWNRLPKELGDDSTIRNCSDFVRSSRPAVSPNRALTFKQGRTSALRRHSSHQL